MVDAGAGGRIVNVTSVHEHVPHLGMSAYCAAEEGLGLLTKVVALELAEHGVTVYAVAFLASPEASYVTGDSLVVDGGLPLMAAVRNQ